MKVKTFIRKNKIFYVFVIIFVVKLEHFYNFDRNDGKALFIRMKM